MTTEPVTKTAKQLRQEKVKKILAESKVVNKSAVTKALEEAEKQEQEREAKRILDGINFFNDRIAEEVREIRSLRAQIKNAKARLMKILAEQEDFIKTGQSKRWSHL